MGGVQVQFLSLLITPLDRGECSDSCRGLFTPVKRKPRPTFCVNVRPWPHSDTGTWDPISWNQRKSRVQAWEESGALTRLHAPLNWIWGTKGPLLRPRCVGAVRSRTPLSIYLSYLLLGEESAVLID